MSTISFNLSFELRDEILKLLLKIPEITKGHLTYFERNNLIKNSQNLSINLLDLVAKYDKETTGKCLFLFL